MKQKLLLFGLMLLFIISGCHKNMPEESATTLDQLQAKSDKPDDQGGDCRLILDDRDGVYGHVYHYNSRGLVDLWKVDYHDGYPDVYTFTYDNFNHLKTGHALFNSNGFSTDIKYQYLGNKLAKETIYKSGTNTILNIIVTTYNAKGQVMRRGSTMHNEYCTFTYNTVGNNTQVNYFINDALFMKEEFTFLQRNRNPLVSLNGMPFVVFTYDFIFSPWWETSDKFTIYDNGVPTVLVDYDPNSAIMQLGPHKYLTSVRNFDRVSQQNTIAIFQFENCGETDDDNQNTVSQKKASAPQKSRAAIIAKFKKTMLTGQFVNLEDEIKKLKMELN